MHGTLQKRVDEARKIEGRLRQGTDRIVQSVVGPVCKAIWPDKTDMAVAAICKCDPRNARRYMSGELPAPPRLIHAIDAALIFGIED
jgi:hypothetical protein